ncbi:hypothetical protein O181_056541 [Austropuccinia psidii MF-1]|uniref:Uncharacterized protein n=1 Tax=Austropuccinia psidii MF-1 TaxID=1389203 RepID=A0A9Q3E6I7_9BASI|nr:hypothetical protein [Austropuccinia psidii MF-1]
MAHMKIIKKCGGELEHSLRSKCIEPFSTEEYINSLEEIVTRTKIGRKWKKLDIKSPNKPRETFKIFILTTNEQRKFHKCDGIGNLANNFLKKSKINDTVETEDESDSEKYTEESEASESDKINIINAHINNID